MKALADALNVEDIQTINVFDVENASLEIALSKREMYEEDFKMVRKNFLEIIEEGMPVMRSAMRLASESGAPRVYESVATFVRTLTDINKDLLTITRESMTEPQSPTTTNSVTNQTVNQVNQTIFTGTTEALLDLIAAKKQDSL